METLSLHAEPRALPAWSVSSQERRQPQPQLISTSVKLTEIRDVTDEELELIDMRYQRALALMNLETLFAEGPLDTGLANVPPVHNATEILVNAAHRYVSGIATLCAGA